MLQKIKTFILSHKIISGIILLVIIIGGFFLFKGKSQAETSYITAKVEKGTIFSSVSGIGQVETSNSIDLKAKVSSDVTYVAIKAGDVVKKGKLLFSLNSKTAQKSVRDAEISLESAKLSLEKLKIQNSEENMNADLSKAYDDGFSSVSNAFLDLPSTIDGIDNLFGQSNLSDNSARISGNTALSYRDKAENLYYQAQKSFQENRRSFNLIDRNSPKTDIENIINETYKTNLILSDAIKSTKNFVDYLVEDTGRASDFTSSQTTLSSYTSTINSHLSSLSSAGTNIKNYKDTSLNSNLDIQASLLSLQQKENSLQDAKDNLSDYYVFAPFDGTISSVVAKIGDTASGVLATIITNQKVATIPLNEVDIASIKIGQDVDLTFDAIDGLAIKGKVAEIDSIGTVSQGVVTYNVKISFDMDDSRIKPGMSVSATIITNTAKDVLVVPNGAVKTQRGANYVQIFDSVSSSPAKPTKVEIGLTNDTSTEILSGLKEGDVIVAKTITGTTTSKAITQVPSIMNAVGGSRTASTKIPSGGGGNFMQRD